MLLLLAGNQGEEQDRTGAEGKDEILDVPLGTVAKRADTDEVLCSKSLKMEKNTS